MLDTPATIQVAVGLGDTTDVADVVCVAEEVAGTPYVPDSKGALFCTLSDIVSVVRFSETAMPILVE